MKGEWFNFKTGQHELLDDVPHGRLKEFISQDPSAQGMFDNYQKLGRSELEAFIEVSQVTSGFTAKPRKPAFRLDFWRR